MLKKQNTLLYIAAFVILNVVLKSIFLWANHLSYDEIISIGAAKEDFGHVKHMADWDNNPPFYYYCLWIWLHIFPTNEFWVRELSVIFVAIGIGLFFKLINERLNLVTAISTCLFLTFSNLITFYAQDARAYSLVLLLAVISSNLFFKFLDKGGYKELLLLSLVNFLIIYTHYIASLMVAMQFAFILFFEREKIKKFYFVQMSVIVGLVLIRFTKNQYGTIFNFNTKGDFWLKPATFHDFIYSLDQLFFFPLLLIFLFINSVWLFRKLRSDSDPGMKFLVYSLMLGPFCILILYFVGIFKAVYLARYLIFTIPFTICFLFYCLGKLNRIGILASFGVVLVSASSTELKPIKGMEYTPVINIIRAVNESKSCILVNTPDNLGLFYYYFDKESFGKFKRHDSLLKANNIFGIRDTMDLKKLELGSFKLVYLVQSFNKKVSGKDIIRESLNTRFKPLYFTDKYNATEFTIYKVR